MSTVSASRPGFNARPSAFLPSAGCTVTQPNAADEQPLGSTITAADLDRMWAEDQARRTADDLAAFGWVEDGNGYVTAFNNGSDDDDTPPPGSPAFPEIVTWKDDELIVAIGLADRRELNLGAVGNVPDRHARFLDEATSELLHRMVDKIGAAAAAAPALAA